MNGQTDYVRNRADVQWPLKRKWEELRFIEKMIINQKNLYKNRVIYVFYSLI